jgi:hypothetical protein
MSESMPESTPGLRFLRETGICAGAAIVAMLFAVIFAVRDRSYFWRDDFQANYLPRFQEVARAVRHGEFPLLAPNTWQAGALGGEFQFAVFSPWSLACVSIVFAAGSSLPVTAATLSILHFGLMASGACRLARSRGLPAPESLLVALTSALNGWIWVWGGMTWFVALAGLAWLPWAWFGLEHALREQPRIGRSVLAGVLIALLIMAGWHFACLMIGLVSAVLLLRATIHGRLRLACRVMSVAWGVGVGLSAPAWLMLLEYSSWTLRGQVPAGQLNWVWSVPPRGLIGLLMPAVSCTWSSFDPLRAHLCVELAGAFVPLAGVVAALIRLSPADRRALGWDLGQSALVLALAMGPGVGSFRWSFRWLPLFFLSLSLAAGEGLARMRRSGGGTAFVGLCALVLAGVGLLAGIVVEEGSLTFPLHYGFGLTAACAAWGCALGRIGKVAGPWIPAILVLGSLGSLYTEPDCFRDLPTWIFTPESGNLQRVSPGITYLGIYSNSDVYGRPTGLQECYAGNSFLYPGLTFVNGYSPLRLAGLSRLFGFGVSGAMSEEASRRMLHLEAGPSGLLELLGVDGLVVIRDRTSPDEALRRQGWDINAEWDTGRVWHRLERPSPRVRVLAKVDWISDSETALREFTENRHGPVPLLVDAPIPVPAPELGQAHVRIIRERRNSIEVAVDHADPGRSVLVAVSRPWYPGYTATLNGSPVPVYRLDLAIPVVLLPPGSNGTLALEYRPAGLRFGSVLCVVTLIGITLALLAQLRARQRRLPS